MDLFGDDHLRSWFFESFPPPPCSDRFVSTVGSEPFSEADIDDLLGHRGIKCNFISEKTEILIVGKEGWDEDELKDLLDLRAGNSLKVYSQEMYLAYWITGRDPYDDQDILLLFGQEHPVLTFLSGVGFDWPTTLVKLGNGEFIVEFPEVGLLKYMGYKTGKNGLLQNERKIILARVFEEDLPNVNSIDYMSEWGKPNSERRLRKLANSIASFCRNEKRRANSSSQAISDWEDDLEWLREKYHRGHLSFHWPSTQVR